MIQTHCIVVPVSEEIMKAFIKKINGGWLLQSRNLSVCFFCSVVVTKQKDDTKMQKVKEYFSTSLMHARENSMDEIIQELEDHLTISLVVNFRKVKKG